MIIRLDYSCCLYLDGALNNDSATFWQLFLGISGSTIKFKGKIALTNF